MSYLSCYRLGNRAAIVLFQACLSGEEVCPQGFYDGLDVGCIFFPIGYLK